MASLAETVTVRGRDEAGGLTVYVRPEAVEEFLATVDGA